MAKKYIFLALGLIFISFIARVYRTSDLLRFYYDQGRDAVTIARVIETKTPVLVGPTTGLAGILRGPAFYYLLLPGYLIGRGDPAIAAIWLQLINLVGLWFIFLFAAKLFRPRTGLIALIFFSLSIHLISLSRWLSNPSPIFTSVPIMLYGLLEIKNKRHPKLWWPIVALMMGLNLQFEMASEIWFIPIVFLFLLLGRLPRPSLPIFLLSTLVFLATLIPQVAFDLRHDGIMRQGIVSNFSQPGQKSFGYNYEIFRSRIQIYIDSFTDIVAENIYWAGLIAIGLVLVLPIIAPKFTTNAYPFFYGLFLIPLVILFFYIGNYGNFYKYYLVGLLPLFVVFLSAAIDYSLSSKTGLVFVLLMLSAALYRNLNLNYYFYKINVDGGDNITLGNQLHALDWIYQQAKGEPFSIDFYLPPVIPYTYNYLFTWYGQKKYHYQPVTDAKRHFSLNEIDQENPQNLIKYLNDEKQHFGRPQATIQFGGLYVNEYPLQ